MCTYSIYKLHKKVKDTKYPYFFFSCSVYNTRDRKLCRTHYRKCISGRRHSRLVLHWHRLLCANTKIVYVHETKRATFKIDSPQKNCYEKKIPARLKIASALVKHMTYGSDSVVFRCRLYSSIGSPHFVPNPITPIS